jgi:hypothetical protein
MTLMGRLGNVPITRSGSSSEDGAVIFTSASTFFFFSSTSEMKSCFPTQRPIYVVPVGASFTSKIFPDAEVHSIEPSWGIGSPEMQTVTRGGQSFGSSPRRTTSVHHELPIIIAVGGGQRNRFSVPYDFCATLLDMTITVRSPNARRFGVRTYWSRYGLIKKGLQIERSILMGTMITE